MPLDGHAARGDHEDLLGLDPEVEPAPDATHHARPTLPHAGLVALGGAFGTVARDGLLHLSPARHDGVPWMLVALNVVGAALLGLLVARVLDLRPAAVGVRLLCATGLLGGFTTYSSLVVAALLLEHTGHPAVAAVTLLGTLVVGVGAAWLGSARRSVAA